MNEFDGDDIRGAGEFDLSTEDEDFADAEFGDFDGFREDGFRDDVEADADTLASAGWGTDEDYGCFDSGNEDW